MHIYNFTDQNWSKSYGSVKDSKSGWYVNGQTTLSLMEFSLRQRRKMYQNALSRDLSNLENDLGSGISIRIRITLPWPKIHPSGQFRSNVSTLLWYPVLYTDKQRQTGRRRRSQLFIYLLPLSSRTQNIKSKAHIQNTQRKQWHQYIYRTCNDDCV